MRKPVIAGNWKMYKSIGEAKEYVRVLKPLVVGNTTCEIVLAPPFTAIREVSEGTEDSNIAVAGQNVAAESGPGAFTGEVSGAMLKDAGASFAIIGHSERRQYYGETDDIVNRKIRAALGADLTPIVCIGEKLEEREANNAEQIVGGQIAAGLVNLTPPEASRIIVAYEPIWAIGTGRTATPEIAQQMQAFIRSRVRMMFGEQVSEGARILYGGSVKPDNIASLMRQPDIDGVLVGGASLEAESFARIVNFDGGR